jgi:hypothetical protein
MFFLMLAAFAQARDTARDEVDLRLLDAAVCHAFEIGDARALRRYLDDRFTLTSSRGEVTNFEQNLAEVAKREPFYDVFRNRNQKIRLYGDAAIITGVTSVSGRAKGEPFAAEFQFTDTWIFAANQWHLAASHASNIPK